MATVRRGVRDAAGHHPRGRSAHAEESGFVSHQDSTEIPCRPAAYARLPHTSDNSTRVSEAGSGRRGGKTSPASMVRRQKSSLTHCGPFCSWSCARGHRGFGRAKFQIQARNSPALKTLMRSWRSFRRKHNAQSAPPVVVRGRVVLESSVRAVDLKKIKWNADFLLDLPHKGRIQELPARVNCLSSLRCFSPCAPHPKKSTGGTMCACQKQS